MEGRRRWQKVKEIVGSALERSAAERFAYLDQEWADDPELRCRNQLAAVHLPRRRRAFGEPLDAASAEADATLPSIGPYV